MPRGGEFAIFDSCIKKCSDQSGNPKNELAACQNLGINISNSPLCFKEPKWRFPPQNDLKILKNGPIFKKKTKEAPEGSETIKNGLSTCENL